MQTLAHGNRWPNHGRNAIISLVTEWLLCRQKVYLQPNQSEIWLEYQWNQMRRQALSSLWTRILAFCHQGL